MKVKYILVMLLLAVILCSAVSAADDNETEIILEETSDEEQVLETFNESIISDTQDITYFDASAEEDGDGSEQSPYKYLYDDRLIGDVYLKSGVYELMKSDESDDYDYLYIWGANITGEDIESTVIYTDYYLAFLNENHFSKVTLYDIWAFSYDFPPDYISSVIMDNVIVKSLVILGGTFNITNSRFEDNEVGKDSYNNSYGAAIYNFYSGVDAAVNLKNCTFINNTADFGGAIYLENANLTVEDCRFINNTAGVFGGAIAVVNSTNVKITDTEFTGNSALLDSAGGVYAINSNLVMDNVNITSSAGLFGSAVTLLSSNSSISKSRFKSNRAEWYGGAVYAMYGNLTITESVFENNSALYGGALFIDSTEYGDISANFTDNTAFTGSAIYSFGNSDISYDNNYTNCSLYENSILNLTVLDVGDYLIFRYNATDYDVLPSSYNLADYGFLTSVKNQVSDGNCWAFTAMAVLESCILKASNLVYDFSEENMKNIIALYSDYGWNEFLTNNGGNMYLAAGYLTNWLGPVSEEDDVYTSNDVLSPLLKSIFHVQNIVFLKRNDYLDNDMIKDAILKYGAVGTSMCYYDDYLNNETNAYYMSDYYDLNHAVTIVGWNDSYSASNFLTEPEGDGAWIVKNSWGEDWGDNGYFYVSYYDPVFAEPGDIAPAYTFILNDTIKYDKNYQYDIGCVGFWEFISNKSITYCNVFEIEGDEYLAAVSTYFMETYDYVMTVTVNDEDMVVKTGRFNAGYYTIPLDEFIKLSAGDEVVITFTLTSTNGGNASFAYFDGESANHAVLSEGVSYVIYAGNYYDLSEYGVCACIKAFTLVDEIKTYLSLSFNSTHIIASVSDIYGNILGGNVTFSVNDDEQTVLIVEGSAAIPYDFSAYDLYSVSALWVSEGYADVQNQTSVETDWDVSISATSIDYGNPLTVDLTLSKTLLNNLTVKIGDNEYYIDFSAGSYTFSDIFDADTYDIKVTYITPNGYQKTLESSFTVNTVDAVLDDLSEFEFDYGSYYDLSVSYEGGDSINATVINHTEALIIISDSSLRVSGLSSGNYTLNVTVNGDKNHNSVSKTVKFIVNKLYEGITVVSEDGSEVSAVSYGSNTVLSVYADGVKFTNYTVLFDGSADNVVLNTDGTFYLKNLTVGTYDLYVELDDANRKGNKTVSIEIVKGSASLEIPDLTLSWSESGSVSAVTIGSGIKLTSESEYIKIEGKEITVLSGLDVGNYTFTFAVDDTNWESSEVEFKLEITKADFDLDVNVSYDKYTLTVKTNIDGDYSSNLTDDFTVSSLKSDIAIDLDDGVYKINVTFKGSDYYNPASKTAEFTVKSPSIDVITSFEFDYGGYYDLEITYSDADSITAEVVNHTGSVSIDGNVITLSGLDAGDYILNITAAGMKNTSKTVDFTVNKLTAEISVVDVDGSEVSSVSYGSNTVLSVYADSVKFTNYIVLFNGSADNVVLNSDGTFYLKNLTVGTYDLYVELNNTNREGNKTVSIEIVKGTASLEIPDLSLVYGESGSVDVTTQASAVKLTSESDYIAVNGKEISVSSGLDVGNYTFTFAVDDVNWESSEVEFKLTVTKADFDLDVSVSYDKYTLTVKTNIDGDYSSNLTDDFTVQNGEYKTVIDLEDGAYNANITFKGNDYYNPVFEIVEFNVISPTIDDIDSFEFNYGTSYKLEVTYSDADSITVKVVNHTDAVIMDANIITLSGLDAGKYVLNITAAGMKNTSKSIDFTVNKINLDLMVIDENGSEASNVTYAENRCLEALSIAARNGLEKFTDYTVSFNGSADNVIVNSDGTFYLRNLTAGTYELYVEVGETNRKGNRTVSIEILKGIVSLEIPELTLAYGEGGSVNADWSVKLIGESDYISVNGKVISVSAGLVPGNYTFAFSVDDANWKSPQTEFKLTVTKADIDINISAEYENAALIIVSDTDGNYTSNLTGDFTLENGSCKIPLELQSGVYKINVTFKGSDYYNEVSEILSFKVKETSHPSIVIPDLSASAESTISVVLNENATGNVTLTVDGDIVDAAILVNGTAVLNVAKLASGSHVIAVSYSGDENFTAFSVNKTVEVASLAKISASNLNVFYLDGSFYRVYVASDDGSPSNGVTVTVKIASKTLYLKTVNGYASCVISEVPGTYRITAEANGMTAVNSVTVKQVIKAKKTTKVKKSKAKKIKITLKGKTAYKNKKISVKLKGKKYTLKTNKKGVAKFKVSKKILKKLKKGKKYAYTITYSKDTLKRFIKIK